MKKREDKSHAISDLNGRADGPARQGKDAPPEDIGLLSPDDPGRTEPEAHYETLRRTRRRLDATQARYVDLYDQAPVGYITVNDLGIVLEANLTAALLLGIDRRRLVKEPFARFLTDESADIFYWQRKRLLESGGTLAAELELLNGRGKRFWAHVAATAERGPDRTATLRIVLSDISALKKAEAALHKSEAFNRAVLDSLDSQIAVLDREGRIVAVNRAWQRFALENSALSGAKAPVVWVGISYLAVCEAASDNALEGNVEAGLAWDGIQAVLDGRLPEFHLEYPCHSPKEQRWFCMDVAPFGEGAVVSHTSITHVKHLEEQAKASALYLRNLVEAIPEPLVVIGTDGRITDVNAACERITGVDRHTLIGSHYADCFTDRERVSTAYRRVILQGSIADFPLSIRHVSGRITDVLVSASQYRDSEGNVLGVFATAHDITEQRRTFEQLREQKEFFHLIAENMSDFIAVLDTQGRRIYNSPSYRQFFGTRRELRGTDSFSDVHPDDRERVRKTFEESVRTGQGRQLEYRMVIADEDVRHMESRGSVIKDAEGRATRVVVVSRDITERKQMEAQVRQMAFHDSLTQLPNRRLLNDRLRQTMAASARSGYHSAVILLDLDNFKPLNDRHGHDAGDLLLVEVAARLKRSVREMDTVARFGGDEFVVMISELALDKAESMAEAAAIAEKIRICLAEPYRLVSKRAESAEEVIEHRCTASIGVVVFLDHEAGPDRIIKNADIAMYRAKECGRNSVRFVAVDYEQAHPMDTGSA